MDDSISFTSFILSIGSLIVSIVTNVKHSKCSNCMEFDNRSNPNSQTTDDITEEIINIEYSDKYLDKSTQTNTRYQDNFTQTNIKLKDISVQTQKIFEII